MNIISKIIKFVAEITAGSVLITIGLVLVLGFIGFAVLPLIVFVAVPLIILVCVILLLIGIGASVEALISRGKKK